MEDLRAVGRTLERFVSELARDDFLEGDVSEGSARTHFHHGPMSQAELTHSLGDDIDQELLIGDDLGCFLKELSRHIAQGTDGAECFRRELKNGRRVARESRRKNEWSDHGNEKANRDFAGGAPGCQSDLLSACHERGNTRSKAWPKEIRGRQFGLWLSLVERLVRDQEAVGSNPTSPIIFIYHRFSSKFRNLRESAYCVDASFQSAPNERNSPHYDYDHRIWDRVFSCGNPDALAPAGFKFIIGLCNSKRRTMNAVWRPRRRSD